MKRHTLFIYLVALMTLFSTELPVSAQEKSDQNMLYIFRNDGSFDAFFFSDIDFIGYSKIDTLGVEHNEYVVQEIYALDTLFRIPITAIDSVSFVTPSTVYKTDVVRPDKSMTDYIVASDSATWFRLSPNTPESIVPKKGEKLLIEKPVEYLPNGFSGIVTSVDKTVAGYTVITDEVTLEDLFDRYVAKASGGTPSPEGSVRRRAAARKAWGDGYIQHEIDEKYEMLEPIDDISFSGSFGMGVGGDVLSAFNGNFTVSLDGSFTGTYSYSPVIDYYKAYFYWDVVEGCTMSEYLKITHKDKYELSLSGQIGATMDFPFTFAKDAIKGTLQEGGKKLVKKIGDFNLDLGFGFFIGGSGVISCKFNKESTISTIFSSVYKGKSYQIPKDDDFHVVSVSSEEVNAVSAEGWADNYSMSLGFFGKAETKIPFMVRKKEYEAEAGARVEAGVKMELSTEVNPGNLAAVPLLESGKLYNLLNHDDAITWSLYASGTLGINISWYKPVNFALEFTPFRRGLYGFVPDVTDIRWDVDKKAPWRGDMISWYGRDLLMSMYTGFAVYDTSPELKEPVQVKDWWYPIPYMNPKVYDKIQQTFDDFEPGRFYTAYPQLSVFGMPMLTDKKIDFTLGPPNINPDKDYLEFDEGFGSDSTNVRTNVANTEFKTDAKWLNLTWYKEIGKLDLSCDRLPDVGEEIRKTNVIGIGYDKEGKEIARDTIKVAQLRPTIGSRYAEFDAKASTKTIKVFTTVTNMEYSFAKTAGNNPDNFCSFSVVNDSTLLITVKENKGPKRTAVIDAKGTSRGGKYASGFVTVIQEGTGEESPFDPTDPESYKLPGDTVDLNYLEYSLDFEVKDESIHSESTSNYYTNVDGYNEENEPGQRCTATYDGQYLYALLLNEKATVYLKIDNNAFAAPIVDGWVILKDGEAFVNMRLKDVPSRSGWEKNEIRFGSRHPGEKNENYSPSQSPLTGLSKNLSSYSSYFYANLEHYRDEYEDGYYVPYKKYIILSDENINKLTYFSLYFTLKKYFDNRDNYNSERNNVYLSEFPDSSVIKQVEEAGMPVYLGSNPPPLDMACTLKPYALANAQGPDDTSYLSLLLFKEDRKDVLPDYMHVKFTPTEDKNVLFEVAYDYSSSPLGALYKQAYGTAKIRHSYGKFAIQGDGNRFTLSKLVKNPGGSGLMMISGEIDGENIKNLYFLGADKLEESFSLSTYSAAYTLIYDGDYISESFNWDEMDWSTWIISNDEEGDDGDARRRAPFIPMKISANSK